MNGGVFALAVTAAAVLTSLLLRPYLDARFLRSLRCRGLAERSGITAVRAELWPRPLRRLPFFTSFQAADSQAPVSLWRTAAQIAAFLAIAVLITWITSAWRENRRLLEATLSSIGDAVLATDREGHVTFLNPVAETLTGWPKKEARGKPASEILKLVHEGTHEPVENPLARALRERATVSLLDRTALVTRNGVECPIELSASPARDESAGLRGAILVFRDIGKRRQLEEQLTHAEKMDAVGRLARGVAGDFNNVLTVIYWIRRTAARGGAALEPAAPFRG